MIPTTPFKGAEKTEKGGRTGTMKPGMIALRETDDHGTIWSFSMGERSAMLDT